MVESTLIRKKMEKEMKFPLLVEAKDSGLIVLFVNKTTGTVVKKDKLYDIGYYVANWVECDNEKEWTILNAGTSITLTVK